MTFVPERWDVGRWDQAHWDGQLGLDAAKGTVTLSAAPVTFRIGRKLIATKTTIAVTQFAAGLRGTRGLTANKGAIAVAGIAALLKYGKTTKLPAAKASVLLTSYPADLRKAASFKLVADTRALVVTGPASALRSARRLTAVTRAILISGTAPILRSTRRLIAAKATLTLASIAITGQIARRSTATKAALIITGQSATLTARRVYRLTVNTAATLATGYPAALFKTGSYALAAVRGIALALGTPATLRIARKLTATKATLAATGTAAALRYGRGLGAAPGTITLTGKEIDFAATTSHRLEASTATIWLNGAGGKYSWNVGRWDQATWDYRSLDVVLRVGRVLITQSGAITLTGHPVNLPLRRAYRMPAIRSAVTLTGHPAGLSKTGAYALDAAKGSILVAPSVTALRVARALIADKRDIIVTGRDAELIYVEAEHGYTMAVSAASIIVSGQWADLHHKELPPSSIVTPKLAGELRFGHRVVLLPNQW